MIAVKDRVHRAAAVVAGLVFGRVLALRITAVGFVFEGSSGDDSRAGSNKPLYLTSGRKAASKSGRMWPAARR